MKYILSVSAVLLFFTLTSCISENVEEDFPTGPCDIVSASYSVDIQPIIESNCYRCHDAQTNLGGVVLESYSNVAAYANNGALKGVIRGINGFPIMPNDAAAMLECDILLIEKWIEEGAQNN